MAVEVDATTVKTETLGNFSFEHSCAGENRLLTVRVMLREITEAVPVVRYNAVELTQIGKIGNGGTAIAWIGYLKAPPSGAHLVEVEVPVIAATVAVAESLKGVDQTSPIAASATAAGTAEQAITKEIASAGGGLVLDALALNNTTDTPTVGAGQTATASTSAGLTSAGVTARGSYEPGAASVTMSWTHAGGTARPWALVLAALRSAEASASSSSSVALSRRNPVVNS